MTAAGIGLGRFAADLPPVDEFVTLGEGDTPLLALPALARRLEMHQLSAKMESLNPTGSYKDRVAAMSLSLAVQRGAAGWIATSSGNAGMSMAAYGARAGLPGFLCLVASAPVEKRLPLMPYRSRVVGIEGVGQGSIGSAADTLIEHVHAASVRHNLYLGITANTLNLDGMRGIDTIGYELAEQCPDATYIYVPTGGGGLLVSLARGLDRRGMTPKLVACQPSGCAPIARFLNGEISAPRIDACDSDISALQLPHPPDGAPAVDAVRGSSGWGTAVTDDAILAAQRLLAETEGIFVEPASAAALAGLIHDLDHGAISADGHAVLILSGAGWKDLARFAPDAAQLPVIGANDVALQIDDFASALEAGDRAR